MMCRMHLSAHVHTRTAVALCVEVAPAGSISGRILSRVDTRRRGLSTVRVTCGSIATVDSVRPVLPSPPTAGVNASDSRHQARRPITSCRIGVTHASSGHRRIIRRYASPAILGRRPPLTVGSVGERRKNKMSRRHEAKSTTRAWARRSSCRWAGWGMPLSITTLYARRETAPRSLARERNSNRGIHERGSGCSGSSRNANRPEGDSHGH